VALLPASGSYDILMSTVDPPFTDKRVRQAIDLALDRQRFADTLMYGTTSPTYIIWLQRSPRSNAQGFARQPYAGSPVLEDVWLA